MQCREWLQWVNHGSILIQQLAKATAGDVLRQARKTEKLLKRKGPFFTNRNFIFYACRSPLRFIKLVLPSSVNQTW